jgi:hypothetical protein
MIKKGDLVGFKAENKTDMLIITKVVREGRFYFSYSMFTKKHSLLVWDPACHFHVCSGVYVDLDPDLDSIKFSANLMAALEKLFGFLDSD